MISEELRQRLLKPLMVRDFLDDGEKSRMVSRILESLTTIPVAGQNLDIYAIALARLANAIIDSPNRIDFEYSLTREADTFLSNNYAWVISEGNTLGGWESALKDPVIWKKLTLHQEKS